MALSPRARQGDGITTPEQAFSAHGLIGRREQLRPYEMLLAMSIEAFAERARRELLATGDRSVERCADRLTTGTSRVTTFIARFVHVTHAGSAARGRVCESVRIAATRNLVQRQLRDARNNDGR